jgi:hypothetical protein
MVSATLRRSSFMISTSAASLAVSVPAPPIEKPMCAAASDGLSLMPSPTMPTWTSPADSSATSFCLSAGSSPARTSSMPTCWAMAWAVAWLSPVSITGRTPSAFSSATACLLVSLVVSATANMASAW